MKLVNKLAAVLPGLATAAMFVLVRPWGRLDPSFEFLDAYLFISFHFEHPHPSGYKYSGVGHSRDRRWALQAKSGVGPGTLWGWTLQAKSGLGTPGALWGWALQAHSGVGRSGTLGLGTPGMSEE